MNINDTKIAEMASYIQENCDIVKKTDVERGELKNHKIYIEINDMIHVIKKFILNEEEDG